MARKVFHEKLRNIDTLSPVGKIHINQDGSINLKNLSDEQIDQLVSISGFNEPEVVKKQEAEKAAETEEDKAKEVKEEKTNLYTMKIQELKDYASARNIKLTATKRNDIINQIKEAEK